MAKTKKATKKTKAKKVVAKKKKTTKVAKVKITRLPLNTIVLVDRSGSMGSRWTEAVGSINAYAKALVDNKTKGNITIVSFDDADPFTIHRDHSDINKFSEFTEKEVRPRGMTPLYDAAAKAVDMAFKDNQKSTAIVIMTDGMENASRSTTREQIKSKLDEARNRGWEVLFLGADFETDIYQNIGVAANKSFGGTTQTLGARMYDTGTRIAAFAATGQAVNYTSGDKAAAWAPDPNAVANANGVVNAAHNVLGKLNGKQTQSK